MNNHAIVICHGTLAEGFKTNIETILGPSDKIHPFSNTDIAIPELIEKIRKYIDTNHITRPFFFVDLKGGSCWKAAKVIMKDYENSFLVNGMNLAVLIKFLTSSDSELTLEWLIERGKISMTGER